MAPPCDKDFQLCTCTASRRGSRFLPSESRAFSSLASTSRRADHSEASCRIGQQGNARRRVFGPIHHPLRPSRAGPRQSPLLTGGSSLGLDEPFALGGAGSRITTESPLHFIAIACVQFPIVSSRV